MFEADAAHHVGKAQQKVVVVVVMRTEDFVSLLHEVAMHLKLRGRDDEFVGPIRHDVHMHRHFRTRIEIDAREIAAGEHRRVRQAC